LNKLDARTKVATIINTHLSPKDLILPDPGRIRG
jgi:hypothetical protein